MNNVTSSWAAVVRLARGEGRSMTNIPTDKLAELVERLRELDRVFIAAESFVAGVGGAGAIGSPWSGDEAEGLAYLAQAIHEAQP